MSRYSPTVLPEADMSLANALSGLSRGIQTGEDLYDRNRQRKRQDVADREREEDRNRYTRQLQAADLAEPGAMSLDAFLSRPGAGADVSAPSLRALGNASTVYQGDSPTIDFTPEAAKRFRQTATGPVVDTKAAAATSLADYLQRQQPVWQAREHLETIKGDQSMKRVVAQQTGAGERAAKREAGADRRAGAHEAAATGRTRISADAASARASAGRATGDQNRETERLQHELDRAQRDRLDLQNHPVRAGQPGHRQWLESFQRARAAEDKATADVNAILPHPGASAGSRTGAGAGGAPTKTAQDWVNEVAAEPAWSGKSDAEIIAEARRRSGQR